MKKKIYTIKKYRVLKITYKNWKTKFNNQMNNWKNINREI